MATQEMLESGKYSEAIPLLQNQISEDPSNTAAACDCAFAHLQIDMARGCLKLCDQAIAADSSCIRAHALKAKAYIKMNKRKKASAFIMDVVNENANAKADKEVQSVMAELGLDGGASAGSPGGSTKSGTSGSSVQQPVKAQKVRGKSVWNTKVRVTQLRRRRLVRGLCGLLFHLNIRATSPLAPPLTARAPHCSQNTWEEVDMTDWAISRLEQALEGVVYTLPNGAGDRT